MATPEIIISWLLAALGQKLLAVNALFHVFDSQRNGGPQEIEFLFESSSGKLYCESDGASIGYSTETMVGGDLGEYGEHVAFSVSTENYFSNVVCKKLLSASIIKSAVEQAVVGITMRFDNESQVSILNLGDDIYVYGDIPENIVCEEGLDFIAINP